MTGRTAGVMRKGEDMGRVGKVRLETMFDLLLMLVGIMILVVSWGYGFGSFRRPGPGLYPFLIGAFVFVLSFILCLYELKPKETPPIFEGNVFTFIWMVITFCLWIVVMPLLGYVIVTLLATFAFAKIMKLEGWWKPSAVAVGTAVFIYLLFDYWLYIDLPRGLLG
jgi:putative tricarboxylic transport membrane protein